MKILIVTHYFPPLAAIASLRPYSWAKYWSREGYEVVVLTTKKTAIDGVLNLLMKNANSNHFDVQEVAYLPFDYKKIKTYSDDKCGNEEVNIMYNMLAYAKKQLKVIWKKWRMLTGSLFDIRILWILPAVRRALKIYKTWKFDVVVSTYGPMACHIIPSILKRFIPFLWVADYRDLWYGDHIQKAWGPFSLLEKCIENYIVSKADMISTVSEPLKKVLEKRFGNKVVTIENGFDIEDVDDKELSLEELCNMLPLKRKKTTLIYTGTIYVGERDPSPLFEALVLLKNKIPSIHEKLEVLFYGLNMADLEDLIKKYDLNNIVRFGGFLPREEILKLQRSADGLIFLQKEDPSIDGIVTGKLFEYMFSGKPILGIGVSRKTLPGRLIEDSGTGFALGTNIENIAITIEQLINGEKINIFPNNEIIMQYTRERLAKKFLGKILELYKSK